MKTEISMGVLGIYIFNPSRGWYVGTKAKGAGREVVWGKFEDAQEWTEGEERKVEELREAISGNDATYTIALLQ